MGLTPPHKLDDDGHSVERFIERHYGDDDKPSYKDAEAVLNSIREHAVFVEDLPDEGQQIWRVFYPYAEVKMVVRDGVVCTVLPVGAERPKHRRRSRP